MRTTGARRPENAKKHNAIAPKNTISRKDVERDARFTEANGLPRPTAKTYAGKTPSGLPPVLDLSALMRWASAVRPELQDSHRRSIIMHIDAATIVVKSRADKRVFGGPLIGWSLYCERQRAVVASLRFWGLELDAGNQAAEIYRASLPQFRETSESRRMFAMDAAPV